jgi:hypothetical protein
MRPEPRGHIDLLPEKLLSFLVNLFGCWEQGAILCGGCRFSRFFVTPPREYFHVR